jgi:uncharacterized ParB-like nuclease family protein
MFREKSKLAFALEAQAILNRAAESTNMTTAHGEPIPPVDVTKLRQVIKYDIGGVSRTDAARRAAQNSGK